MKLLKLCCVRVFIRGENLSLLKLAMLVEFLDDDLDWKSLDVRTIVLERRQ